MYLKLNLRMVKCICWLLGARKTISEHIHRGHDFFSAYGNKVLQHLSFTKTLSNAFHSVRHQARHWGQKGECDAVLALKSLVDLVAI